MRVSAILVVNDRPGSTGAASESNSDGLQIPAKGPIACAEIMGRSVLQRTAERLRRAGIRTISVIAGPSVPYLPAQLAAEITIADNSFARWLAAQQTLREHGTRGMDTVLMIGLGAYLECNVAEALKFHLSGGGQLTQLDDNQGSLDFWVVDSRWFRSAASGCKLPFRYGEFPGLPVPFPMKGYVNRLTDAHDLRRLVLDAFLGHCQITPSGKQVRPGVWVEDGARVHKRSRLVSPVYVGCRATVARSAVVTRFSNVERNCRIGEGTVVDGATVLPDTAVGAWLDISHAVVDGIQFADLAANISLQLDDPRMFSAIAPRNLRTPRHRKFASSEESGKDDLRYGSFQGWSRAAGRLAELFFKG